MGVDEVILDEEPSLDMLRRSVSSAPASVSA